MATHIVDGLPSVTGRISVRDRCDRAEVVDAVVEACLQRDLEPVIEQVSNTVLRKRIMASEPMDWHPDACQARGDFPTDVNAVIVLGGWPLAVDHLPADSLTARSTAVRRAESVLEDRRVPYVVVAVTSVDAATALQRTMAELDALVEPLVLFDRSELLDVVRPLADGIGSATAQELVTPGCRLRLDRGDRPVLVDDGVIDESDQRLGAIVSNLPAGSVYWTVVEDRTRGDVRLGDGSVLRFDDHGRVVDGPFAGERVSHLGVGAHPLVTDPIGWTIVDEHRHGAVFLALGDNRHMGGENASDLNVDLLPESPTLAVGERTIVEAGRPVWSVSPR